MKDCEYLLPPGNEVCAGSATEAFHLFRASGVMIETVPILGAIRSRSNPQTSYCVWAVCKDGFHVIPLFPEITLPQCKDWEFSRLDIDEVIMYIRRRTYKVVHDPHLGVCIRNINFYWHECYAMAEAAIIGYPEARFMLCRIYLTEENNRFLTVCWMGYDEKNNATLFIKMFEEDWMLLAGYSYTELAREAIDVGERFEIHGKRFVLKQDPEGYQFAEPVFYNPHLQVVGRK